MSEAALDGIVREGCYLMTRLTQDEDRVPSALDIAARNYIERMIVLVQDQEAEINRLQRATTGARPQ